MAQNIEDFLPPIQSAGLNTLKNTSLGGTLAVTGNATLSGNETLTGNLAVTGTSLFTGVATFTAAPVFNAGRLVNVVSEATNATLTIAQSGSTVLFNSTTGVRVTLPAPSVGAVYEFVVAQTPSSGTHGINTNSGSVFLQGALLLAPAAGTVATFTANGTSNVQIGMNGTTTGGIQGSQFRAVATSATVWEVTGVLGGSGALATPIV